MTERNPNVFLWDKNEKVDSSIPHGVYMIRYGVAYKVGGSTCEGMTLRFDEQTKVAAKCEDCRSFKHPKECMKKGHEMIYVIDADDSIDPPVSYPKVQETL